MKTVRWVLENFGSIILFQITNQYYGLKPAIFAALAFSVIEFILLKQKKRPITPFFIFSFGWVCFFGIIDLFSANATFFKYESALMSLIMGGYFAISLSREKSLVEELAEQQGRVSNETSPDKTFFFRVITILWMVYFVVKSAAYFWVATNSSMQNAFIFRMIFGTVSFYALLAITIGFNKQIWDLFLKLKWMPSTRGE